MWRSSTRRCPRRSRLTPPITVAALGPIMVRKAVAHADTWNTMSFAETFDEQLVETCTPIDVALAHCDKIGRDPSTLRISYNMFDPGSRSSGGSISYCESPEAFVEQAERLFELEVTELSMYYPMLEEQLPVFETIARDTFPQLRAVHNPAI